MSIKPTFPPKTTPANFSVNLLVTSSYCGEINQFIS